MTTKLLTYADCWRLIFLLACAGLLLAFAPIVGLRIDWSTFTPVFLSASLLSAIGLAYRFFDRDAGIAATTLIVAQIVVYSNIAVLDNYLGLELRRPLIDPQLAGIDAALGLDWWGYVNWVKSLPYIGRLLSVAYQSSLAQVAVAIIILGFTRRLERLDQFTLAFMISSALTIAIWTAFPSYGALVLRYAQGLPAPAFALVTSAQEAHKLLELYAGPTPPVGMQDVSGLIAFPSFHTALAILTIYALWPIRYVGALAVAWNIFVLASIPADGGHHFVDIASGALVTALSIHLGRRTLRRAAKTSTNPKPGMGDAVAA